MPPKRPPPLPKTLFEANGPLASGSARLPPSPSSFHPSFVIDAHSHSFVTGRASSTDMYGLLSPGMPHPPVKAAVQVILDSDKDTPPSTAASQQPISIHPTVLNFSTTSAPSMTNIVKSAIDLIVPSTLPLTEKEWDQLDEAVRALDDSMRSSGLTKQLENIEVGDKEDAGHKEDNGRIVISGLLPPPLTTDSDTLGKAPEYDLYIGRLNQLSLNPIVYLKVLPPVFKAGEGSQWVSDRKELERVLRMYLSPAFESFGTHRLIFGSSSAVPVSNGEMIIHPVSESEWYAVLRKAVTELGEGAEAVEGIFGATAAKVYDLAD